MISEETIRKVAATARIPEEDALAYKDDLSAVLDAFSTLADADVKGVEPTFSLVKEGTLGADEPSEEDLGTGLIEGPLTR